MEDENELITIRKEKLKFFEGKKINPYQYSYEVKDYAAKLKEDNKDLKQGDKGKKAKIAGRVMALRTMGKVTFFQVEDASGQIQVYIKEDDIGKAKYEIFGKIDIGDWIGIEGFVFRTKMGEITVHTEGFELLSKSLRPLPEKWHGLKDTEKKYRQRYLDMIMNPEVRKVFVQKSIIVNEIRNQLMQYGFIEVSTPILQTVYGGAEAEPFVTHMNALNIDLFLAISPELYLKRFIVGGMGRVFTIAKNFRNEDFDRSHNPEFEMLEFYIAFEDYEWMMKFFEKMIEGICFKVHGKTKVKYGEHELDFKAPWARMTMIQAIKKYGKLDIEKLSDAELKKKIKEFELEIGTRDEMINALFEKFCEHNLVQPTFITDHPKGISPLTKEKRGKPEHVERFEVFVAGMELSNAYSELNDPIEQRKRFEEQQKKKEKGDKEAHPMDKDFLTAMEYGFPPCAGLGMGVDRLVMLLTDSHSIRDTIAFPFMKPEEEENV
ncbi:lysine--tRNA ligase [Candidatus Woesearchaeota archaeon]|nr:lysine--tRNA ligase [Candidatus Woesearchaeota archaeon]